MERSAIRVSFPGQVIPHFASLHASYGLATRSARAKTFEGNGFELA
jgi:hypothetical protein